MRALAIRCERHSLRGDAALELVIAAPLRLLCKQRELSDCVRAGSTDLEGIMDDPHQLNSIIATAICEACKLRPDRPMEPEEAKQLAKCILEAIADAGLEVVPVSGTSS